MGQGRPANNMHNRLRPTPGGLRDRSRLKCRGRSNQRGGCPKRICPCSGEGAGDDPGQRGAVFQNIGGEKR